MQETRRRADIALGAILWIAVATACGVAAEPGPRIVQPGAPGDETRVRPPGEVLGQNRPTHTAADVEFMQGMLHHHQQALEMTALVQGRSDRRDLQLLAQRIELTQRAEIELIRRWLERRGEEVPDAGILAHSGAPGDPPPYGMLTPEELARMAAAIGPEFDRLFLELMIRHHEGALAMVADLFASPAGGQESEVFQFASGVAADQPIEIARMRQMLDSSR